jgi:hypothetical protein
LLLMMALQKSPLSPPLAAAELLLDVELELDLVLLELAALFLLLLPHAAKATIVMSTRRVPAILRICAPVRPAGCAHRSRPH